MFIKVMSALALIFSLSACKEDQLGYIKVNGERMAILRIETRPATLIRPQRAPDIIWVATGRLSCLPSHPVYDVGKEGCRQQLHTDAVPVDVRKSVVSINGKRISCPKTHFVGHGANGSYVCAAR